MGRAPDRHAAAREGDGPSRRLLFLTWLAGVSCSAPLAAMGPMLPLVAREFGLTATLAGTIAAVPFLVRPFLAWPGGVLADRVGSRPVLSLALIFIAIFGAGRALVWSTGALLVVAMLLGAAVGVAQTTLASIARSLHPDAARVTALYTAGLNTGVLAASVLSAAVFLPLVDGASWRGVFLLWGLAAAVPGIWWGLEPSAPGAHPHRPAPAAGFLGAQGSRAALLSLAVVFGAQSAIFQGLVAWLPSYYVEHGLSLARASAPVTAMSVGSLCTGLGSPWLLSRMASRGALWTASVVLIAAMAGLIGWPQAGSVWAAAIGGGTGIALTVGLAAAAVMAPPGFVGRVTGFVLTVGHVGAFLGPLLLGLAADATGRLPAGLTLLILIAVLLGVAASVLPVGPPARGGSVSGAA
ncbi:MAG TPA: MFS transporter [bacterium]|nr:MFS transporter [bacterium]